MTTFYTQLIETVTETWGGSGIVIVPETSGGRSKTGSFTPPVIPSSAKEIRLGSGEAFLPGIQNALAEAEHFEWIFILPPWGNWKEMPKRYKRKYHGCALHEACLLECVEKLTFPCHIGVLLPQDFFFGERARKVRERLFSDKHSRMHCAENPTQARLSCYPELVIAHEHPVQALGFSGIHPQFRIGTLFLDVGPSAPEATRFFKYPWSEDERERTKCLSDLQRLMKQGGGETRYGFVVRERLAPDTKLSFDLHSPSTQRKRQELEQLGDLGSLKEVFDILHSGLHKVHDANRLLKRRGEGCLPVIHGRDISREGQLGYDSVEVFIDSPGEASLLQEGDFCIRRIGNFASRDAIIHGRVSLNDPPATYLDSVIVLRPKQPLSSYEGEFYSAYLRSDLARHFLRAKGTTITLNVRDLENLPVPRPSDDLKGALLQLSEVETRLVAWEEELSNARNELFRFADITTSRDRVHAVGRRLRERIDAAQQADSLSYRVRNLFPFPVSFRWRTVMSSNPDLDGYRNVLSCAEAVSCFLAQSLLAVTRAHGSEIGYLKSLSERLTTAGRGTSFGDWLAILREARDAATMQSLMNQVQVPELFTFLKDSEVDRVLQELKNARDDEAHDRGPKTSKAIEERFVKTRKWLNQLFDGLDFLSEYRLRYIEDVTFDSLSSKTRYTYRDLRGDHPLVPPQTDGLSVGTTIEKGSLYTVDPQGTLYLLRPFLKRLYCEQCGNYSTFFLDRYDSRNGDCWLKSLEHGHELKHDSSVDAFKHVGLLESS